MNVINRLLKKGDFLFFLNLQMRFLKRQVLHIYAMIKILDIGYMNFYLTITFMSLHLPFALYLVQLICTHG